MPSSESIQIDTKLLKTFCAVVGCRSFTAASKMLGVSQPTVSQQVQALEQELGVALLVRSHKLVRLTAAGELVLQCAQQVLQNLDRVRRLVAEHSGVDGGRLIIGDPHNLYDSLLAGVISELYARFPKVQITALFTQASQASERLVAREIDFAFITSPGGRSALSATELGREELVAAMAPTHPLANGARLQASDLREQRLILPPAGSGEYPAWDAFMIEGGVFPRVAIETDSVPLAKRLAQEGVAITIVPRWAVQEEVRRGSLRALSLGWSGLWRAWYLAYSPSLRMEGINRVFFRLCREHLPGLLSGTALQPDNQRVLDNATLADSAGAAAR